MKKLKIITDKIEEVDTSESYQGGIVFRGTDMIVPLINVSLSNHPLNTNFSLRYVDRCFIFFKNVYQLSVNSLIVDKANNNSSENSIFYIGATDLLTDQNFEIGVESKTAHLVLLSDTIVTEKMWIPIETPNFRRNMSHEVVKSFLDTDLQEVIRFIQEEGGL